jgi:hypothetical protein
MPRKKTTASKGLGDTVEKVLDATGIGKIAKFILGEDCGCEERKQKLNEIFPYKKVNCLVEHEYQWLKQWYDNPRSVIKPSEQQVLLAIHSRIFNKRNEPTNCGPCLVTMLAQLEEVFKTYENGN